MSIIDHKKEVIRFLASPDGTKVWVKKPYDETWELVKLPDWFKSNEHVVNDKHAEMRKEWIDKSKPPVQYKTSEGCWRDVSGEPAWALSTEYRLKQLKWYEDPDMIGKPIWVKDDDEDKWLINIFVGYDENSRFQFKTPTLGWEHAKPVTCDEVYKGKSNEESTATQS